MSAPGRAWTPPRYLTRTQGTWQFILTMVAFGVLAWLLQGALARQNVTLDQQVSNTKAIQSNQDTICASRNTTIVKINALIDELLTSVKQGSTLPPQEKADRVARYTELKVPLLICPPPR